MIMPNRFIDWPGPTPDIRIYTLFIPGHVLPSSFVNFRPFVCFFYSILHRFDSIRFDAMPTATRAAADNQTTLLPPTATTTDSSSVSTPKNHKTLYPELIGMNHLPHGRGFTTTGWSVVLQFWSQLLWGRQTAIGWPGISRY